MKYEKIVAPKKGEHKGYVHSLSTSSPNTWCDYTNAMTREHFVEESVTTVRCVMVSLLFVETSMVLCSFYNFHESYHLC